MFYGDIMSTTITLYQGCRLSNKYEEVFNGRQTLDDYLATLTSKVVYSSTEDDLYFTNNGSISIDNETNDIIGLVRHGDKYNYLKFERSQDGTRYAFVDSITLVDGICVINYTEDIWNNYALMSNAISFQMKNSLINQAKGLTPSSEYTSTDLNNLPRKLPKDYEGHNPPVFKIDDNTYKLQKECMVLVIASMYTLESPGVVNKRFTSNYLLFQQPTQVGPYSPDTSIASGSYYWNINGTTLDILGLLKIISSDTKVKNLIEKEDGTGPDWNYEIVDIKLIPRNIASSLFTRYMTAETTGDYRSDYGMHKDFEVTISQNLYCSDDAYHIISNKIGFMNLLRNDWNKYRTTSPTYDRWLYNGMVFNERIGTNQTITANFKCAGVGNMSRTIPFDQNGLDHNLRYYFSADAYTNSIEVAIDNNLIDITQDFELPIPVSVQTADVTQQQRSALALSNLNNRMSIFSNIFNTFRDNTNNTANSALSSFGSISGGNSIGGYATAFKAVEGNTYNIFSSIFDNVRIRAQMEKNNAKEHITNTIVNSSEVCAYNCMLGGLRDIEIVPDNEVIVNKMISLYGYLYAILINDISIFSTSTDYIRFGVANIYGPFSQNIARSLESILENGIILLHA